jgi:protein SCO1/2
MDRSGTRTRTVRTLMVTVVGLVVASCGGATTSLSGLVRTPTPIIETPSGTLDDGGRQLTLRPSDPRHLMVTYFGYTSCPDICPTTLADLHLAIAALGSRGDRVDITMVTVDPVRDTEAVLSKFVEQFVQQRATAVRISDAATLAALARPLGVTYDVRTGPDGGVEVDHSAFLYAIDASGHLLVQWPFGVTRTELTRDLKVLLDRLDSGRA